MATTKTWFIIGGVIVLLLIAWFFTQGQSAMTGVDVERNVMDGSTTYSNEEGSVTVGNASMPENWPADAPDNFAGASIQYSGSSNPQTGEAGAAVMYSTRASLQAVTDHYRSALESRGWTVEGTANVDSATVMSATKDSRTFGVHIVDTADGNVTVTAGVGI